MQRNAYRETNFKQRKKKYTQTLTLICDHRHSDIIHLRFDHSFEIFFS